LLVQLEGRANYFRARCFTGRSRGCGRLLLGGSFFFTGDRNNPAIEFFFKRVNATVLIKPFNLKALDSTIRDVLRKLV